MIKKETFERHGFVLLKDKPYHVQEYSILCENSDLDITLFYWYNRNYICIKQGGEYLLKSALVYNSTDIDTLFRMFTVIGIKTLPQYIQDFGKSYNTLEEIISISDFESFGFIYEGDLSIDNKIWFFNTIGPYCINNLQLVYDTTSRDILLHHHNQIDKVYIDLIKVKNKKNCFSTLNEVEIDGLKLKEYIEKSRSLY